MTLRFPSISRVGALIALIGLLGMAPASLRQANWDFERAEPGQIANEFNSEVGRWELVNDDGNRVLAQLAENQLDVFNLTLVNDTSYKDVDLSVRLRAVAGENEGGGGVVWRAKDAGNYYLASFNPLVARHNPRNPNFRLYKIENGKRTQLDHADATAETFAVAPGDKSSERPPKAKWHTLRITMHGNDIVAYLDGKKLLEAEDATFLDVGKIGLWSKSDARTYFDDLKISTYQAPEHLQNQP